MTVLLTCFGVLFYIPSNLLLNFLILTLRQNYISTYCVITEIQQKNGIGHVTGECAFQLEGRTSHLLGLLSFAH